MTARMPLPKLVLMDLDGTLVDTIPDIAACVERLLEELGLPVATLDQVRDWVGNGTEALVRRALAGNLEGNLTGIMDDAAIAGAVERFTQLYARNTCTHSKVFAGVAEGLAFLGATDAALGCVTNKAGAFTTELLAALQLDRHFSLVVSGDTLPRMKPDPLPLLHAAAHFGVAPEQALLIGDSANDVRAARAAGFGIICVSYGYNHGNDIRASDPDRIIDSLAELPGMFEPLDRANATA